MQDCTGEEGGVQLHLRRPRYLMKATTRLGDGDAVHIPGPNFIKGKLLDKLDNTQMGHLATDFGLLPEHGDTKARPRHDDAIA